MIEHISCVIIVKNGALTLAKTLSSLAEFSQVILFDNGSSDDTLKIASQYNNVTIVQGSFTGFGSTKNEAASHASNDWVLSLDADEVLTADFMAKLQAITLNKKTAYQILRVNYYKNQRIKYCWKEEKIVRLYHRQVTAFNDNKVHEFVVTEQLQTEVIDALVHHYPYQSISDFIQKADRYSELFAIENVGKKRSSPLKAVLNAKYSFIKKYFIKRGFLDGYPGLIISFAHMSTNFFKYMKLYEANLEHDKLNRNTEK